MKATKRAKGTFKAIEEVLESIEQSMIWTKETLEDYKKQLLEEQEDWRIEDYKIRIEYEESKLKALEIIYNLIYLNTGKILKENVER